MSSEEQIKCISNSNTNTKISKAGSNSSGISSNSNRNNNIDWRNSLELPTEKLEYMLENKILHDVTFSLSVGESHQQEISCHKFVLTLSSRVFEAMFHGPLAAAEGEIISIPDVDPVAFHLLLKFIYTGKFEASIQNAVNLMYAAKKYDILHLAAKCSELLRSDLTEKNAVTILQAAELLDDDELQKKARSFLLNNFGKVMEDEDFLNFSRLNLSYFLLKDEIDVVEIDLFNAVLKWSQAECERQELDSTRENQADVLKEVIKLIRFTLICAEDFSLTVVPHRILTPEDSLSILQYMSVSPEKRSNLPPLTFKTKTRNTNSIYTAHFAVRLTDMVYPYVSHISYFDSFEVDQPISILSFGFPAPDIDDANYDVAVQIQLQGSNTITAQGNQSLVVKRRSIFRVKFDKPVRIEPGVLYKVVYKLKGPDTFYADQRIENFQVKSKTSKSKIVNFKYIAYSCRLIEIAFIF